MAGEPNQTRWIGIRPTNPEEDIPVKQDTAADLKATVTQAEKDRTVTNATAANLKAEVTQAAIARRVAGLRPSGTTQIIACDSATNTTTIIHTVTGGKTLYLQAVSILAVTSEGIGYGHSGQVSVRDTGDNFKYILVGASFDNYGNFPGVFAVFPVPIEIPANYDIYISTDEAHATAYGTIFGWEV